MNTKRKDKKQNAPQGLLCREKSIDMKAEQGTLSTRLAEG